MLNQGKRPRREKYYWCEKCEMTMVKEGQRCGCCGYVCSPAEKAVDKAADRGKME